MSTKSNFELVRLDNQRELPHIPAEAKTNPDDEAFRLADWREYSPSVKKFVSLQSGCERNTGLNQKQAEFLHGKGLVYRELEGDKYMYFVPSLMRAKQQAKEKLTEIEMLVFVNLGGFEIAQNENTTNRQ